MSEYNLNVLAILLMFFVFAVPGYAIMSAAMKMGFPPLKKMEAIFLGGCDE